MVIPVGSCWDILFMVFISGIFVRWALEDGASYYVGDLEDSGLRSTKPPVRFAQSWGSTRWGRPSKIPLLKQGYFSWWALEDSNLSPPQRQCGALAKWAKSPRPSVRFSSQNSIQSPCTLRLEFWHLITIAYWADPNKGKMTLSPLLLDHP